MKQTAVEFLVEEFKEKLIGHNLPEWVVNIIQQAKGMEKEQIIEAHFTSSGCNSFDMPTDRVNSAYKAAQSHDRLFCNFRPS